MTLKTLKDLAFGSHVAKDDFTQLVRVDKLKAEAIKWYHRSDDNKHKFIREFFNITEEDLK